MKPLLPNKNRIVAKLSIIFALLLGVNQVNAQVLLTESFDGTTFVPVGWTDVLTSGTATWTRATAGTFPTQTPHSGAGEAYFNSWTASAGVRSMVTPALSFAAAGAKSVSFWMYRDNGYLSTADKVDVLINTSTSVVGATNLGTVNRAINLAPIVSANGWYQYTFTVSPTFSTATNYVFFQATSAYGNNIFIDDITITNVPVYPVAANNCGIDYISNVTLSTINRTSTCDVFAPYATPNPTLTQGSTYILSVSTGGDTEGARAWIDYNGDGLFNNAVGTELVLGPAYAGTNPATYTIAVTIPGSATLGVTRLRARCNYASAPVDATTAQTWGETEDYFVTIAAGTSCSGTPNTGTASISSSAGCAGGVVNISTAGLSSISGITYQWKSSSSSLGPWTNIAGATASTYSFTSLVGTTYYELVSTCTTSALSNTTNIVSFNGTSCATTLVPALGSNTVNCGTSTKLYDDGGALGLYANNDNGYTVLNNGGVQTIAISGTYTGIETCCDYLKIYAGAGIGGTLLYTYIGTGTLTSFTSTPGQIITVQFFSDGSVNGAGFDINVIYSGGVPSPTITVNSGAICSGSSFTMAPSGSTTYTFSGGSAVVTPTATTNYTVTSASSSGCIGSAISSVSVDASPIITVNSGSICSGQSFTMVPAGASTYTYSSGAAVVAPTANTSYTVTGTSAAGCIGSSGAVSSVTVNALPVVTVNSGSICNGSSFTMIPAGASTYTYSSGAAVVAPTTNTSYTVTGTSAAGCVGSSGAVSSVTVNASPTITVNSGGICSGSSFTMVPGGASTYTYSSGSAVVAPTTNTSYTVTGTSAAGCVGISGAVSSVTVTSLPVVTVNSGAICAGKSFTMVPSGATTYTYSSGAAVVSPTTNTSYTVTGSLAGCVGTSSAVSTVSVNANPVVTISSGSICSGSSFTMVAGGATSYTYSGGSAVVTPTTSTSYTVTGASVTGCTNTAVSSVTVNAIPAVTVNSGAICSGASFTMVPAGASTYVYSGGSAVVSPTANTSYTVTGTSAAGCNGNAVSTVTVNASPILSVTSGSICSGNSFTMVSSGATTYTYSGGSAVVSPSVTTSYTVSGSNAAGCVSSIVNTITVSATPVIVASSGAICTGGSWTITPTGATTYTYSSGSAVVSPSATTSYTVSGSSAAGCQSSAVVTVSVNPTLAFSANSGSVCIGSTFTMTPSGASSYTYSSGTAAVTPTATTTYTIVGVNLAGCYGTEICTVTVNALPVVSASTSATLICLGESAVLTASTSAATTTYTWSSGVTTMTASVSPTVLTVYSVNVTDSTTTCGASASVTVDVNACTGINELTESSISIYPNPSFGFVKIALAKQFITNSSIAIYDALGKLIVTQELGSEINTLNISELKNGMYTYKVLSNTTVLKIGKIVNQ